MYKINKVVIFTLLLLTLFYYCSKDSYAANEVHESWGIEFEPATNINFTIGVIVSYDANSQTYTFNYTIMIHPDSVQKFDTMRIEYEGNPPIPIPPVDWNGSLSKKVFIRNGQEIVSEYITPNNMYFSSWYKRKGKVMPAGSSQDNLIIQNCSLPGIVNYYVQGYTRPVSFRGGEGDVSLIPDYMTKYYLNSVNGKTLGPVDPPATPFDGVVFSDTIIGYVNESGTLGWISDSAVVISITANLNIAKGKIGSDNPGAIAILDTILADLETQHGGASPSVNDEAYFLIKFNVMYLKDRL